MLRSALVALAGVAVIAAGCGGDDSNGDGEGAPASEEQVAKPSERKEARKTATARGARVKLVSSQFGRILGDRRGQAFYLFDKEKSERSECYGACAEAWPPVLTKGEPRAGSGARSGLLGTTRRRDGKLQVTYGGRPMYYYEHDGPGRVLCHDVEEFGGLWLVLRADGKRVS